MKQKVQQLLNNKNCTVPVLSFPSTQLIGISVAQLINDADKQAQGMKAIADRCKIGASLNMMDLSVEAEAFGAQIRFSENEIPTVTKGIIDSIEEVESIVIPEVGVARTGIYINGIKQAKKIITDIPVFCGVIGPYSLAGRIFDMTELMMSCYDDPDNVKILIEKCSKFISSYIKAFKQAGADGVIMAEPAAGLLSPDLCEEFSSYFVRHIRNEIDDDNFVFCYHNCGGGTISMAQSIASIKADIYHFGNAIDLSEIIPLMPKDSIIMGNVDPVLFRTGTPQQIKAQTQSVFEKCSKYENFMLSSGCDIPAESKWENIDAYFEVVKELYDR